MTRRTNYRQLYDRFAPFYGPLARLFPMWRRYTEAVLPHLPAAGPVLEIGPGPGILLETLAARYPVTAGLDLSGGMLRQSRQRLRAAGLPPRLVQANALYLPFAPGSFESIVLTFAFSAMPDGDGVLAEIARVLRPGGVLALVDACEPADRNRIAMWLAGQWERLGDSMRDEAAMMQRAGLAVVTRREFGAFNSIRLTVGRKS